MNWALFLRIWESGFQADDMNGTGAHGAPSTPDTDAQLLVITTVLFTLHAPSNAQRNKRQNGTWLHLFVSRIALLQCGWMVKDLRFTHLFSSVLLQRLKPGFLLRRHAVTERFLGSPQDLLRDQSRFTVQNQEILL